MLVDAHRRDHTFSRIAGKPGEPAVEVFRGRRARRFDTGCRMTSPMSDVRQVTAIISNPSPHDPTDMGRCTVGYYVVEDNLLTMTYGDGKPFHGRSGEKITHKLQRGDDPTVIAKRFDAADPSRIAG
jgi:hypothetical protein